MDKDTFEPTLQVSRKKEENDNIFGLKFDLRYFFQKGLLTAGTKIINKRQVTYKLLADLKGVIINSSLLLSLKIVTRSHNMSMYYYNPFF